MANTYTPNTQLAMPATGDRNWNVPVNANAQLLDALSPVGALAAITNEVPSSSLNARVAAGSYQKQDGTIGIYAGTSSQAIAASSTKVLYLDLTAGGALVVAASYPTTAHVRIATVVTGTSSITSITDNRVAFQVIGSYANQQTGGAETASATYGSTERDMLNKAYACLRTFGFLS